MLSAAAISLTLLIASKTLFWLDAVTGWMELGDIANSAFMSHVFVKTGILRLAFIAYFLRHQQSRPVQLWPWVIYSLCILPIVCSESEIRDPWFYFVAIQLPPIVGMLIAAGMAWQGDKFTGPVGTDSQGQGSPVWYPAAYGLKLYRQALSWRLVLTFAGTGIMILTATFYPLSTIHSGMTWVLPLIGLVTGCIMTAGICLYSRQPERSRGSGPTMLVIVLMLGSLIIDLVLLLAVIHTLTAEGSAAVTEMQRGLELTSSYAGWSMFTSVVALLVLLMSFHSVMGDNGAIAIAKSCGRLAIVVIGLSSVAFGLRIALSIARRDVTGSTLVFTAVATVVAIVMAVRYLGLVRRVEQQLRQIPDRD